VEAACPWSMILSRDANPGIAEIDYARKRLDELKKLKGIFVFKFLKDDQGYYTICHVVNTEMGLDIKRNKIK
jgi:hypothetical protein